MPYNESEMIGEIISINISQQKGTKKMPVEEVMVREDYGIEGDAHANKWHRQVSLLSVESINKMREEKGLELSPGDFGENLTVKGVILTELPIGTLLQIGKTVVLETTQIGKECHDRCNIYYQSGDCIMPKEGIFARVIKGGNIKKGDKIGVVS